MLIDTHAHLNFEAFGNDVPGVIARAKEAGVEKIICASSNVADSHKAVELAKKYPGTVYAAAGLHPHSVDDDVAKIAELEPLVAIGECGLDFSPAPPGEKDRSREDQILFFRRQIELTQKRGLPLIIHAREAMDETIEILKEYPGAKGVFHCYYGGKKRIWKVLDLGFYFGFDGNLTYDQGLQNVSALIDLKKIVLETDSPYLSPDRGSQNEPKNVKIIASRLAELKKISFDEVAEITSRNAYELFHF